MSETLQDIQIEEYLLNRHDFDLISKYTTEGEVGRALAKPMASLKKEIDTLNSKKIDFGYGVSFRDSLGDGL
jgi:hypothetical protein